jgi:hypothetical protein
VVKRFFALLAPLIPSAFMCQPSRNSLLLTFLRHVIPCPAVT